VIRSKDEASVWLKGSSVWSSIDSCLIDFMWGDVTFDHFDLEFNVRPKRNFEIINWGDGSSTTISVESWAVEGSVITLMELWESNIEAVERLSGSNSNLKWSSISSFFSSIDDSSITKNGSPVESSPVWCGTKWSFTRFCFIDSDSRKIVVGNSLKEVISVSTIYVWCCCDVDGGSSTD